MHETEYTYAVARIRANELKMLSKSDFELLTGAQSYESAVNILTDKGWSEPEGESSYDICEIESGALWSFMSESAPDKKLVDALAVGNDFVNLKAALKSFFSNLNPENYMTLPALCPTDKIIKAVSEGEFADLPDYLRDCAQSAYHTYTEKQSGQLSEIVIDKACAEAKMKFASEAESPLLCEIYALTAAVSDIKSVRRSFLTGKDEAFALNCVSGVGDLDSKKLVSIVYGSKSISEILKGTSLEELSDYADGEFTEFEMYLDNLITQKAVSHKSDIYGSDAVVAYYYGKMAEIKNVRIILSGILGGVDKEIISKRVREIYV